jgi:dTDP-4-amino-4,6-dideoxygalactose transaminase
MHRQPVFDVGYPQQSVSAKKRYAARVVGGLVSDDLFARGLCLPSGTALQERDLERVVSIVRRCGRSF